MKITKRIRNFLLNFYSLCKYASKSEQIFWGNLGGNIHESEIDPQSKLYDAHTLMRVKVGKGTYISKNAHIFNTTIGKFCSIGPNLVSGWGMHPLNGISTSPAFYSVNRQAGFTYSKKNKTIDRIPITIGNDVFIGANVTILDGVDIGDGAVIGAGAVVSKDIPSYAVAVGCPIKIIKYRFDARIIKALKKSQWWHKDEATLQKVEKLFFEVEKFVDLLEEEGSNAASINE